MTKSEEQFLSDESCASRRVASDALREMGDAALELIDPRGWIRHHPYASLGAALGIGTIAGARVGRAVAPAKVDPVPTPPPADCAPQAKSSGRVGEAVRDVILTAVVSRLISEAKAAASNPPNV